MSSDSGTHFYRPDLVVLRFIGSLWNIIENALFVWLENFADGVFCINIFLV